MEGYKTLLRFPNFKDLSSQEVPTDYRSFFTKLQQQEEAYSEAAC